jgi:hypothetical protein
MAGRNGADEGPWSRIGTKPIGQSVQPITRGPELALELAAQAGHDPDLAG